MQTLVVGRSTGRTVFLLIVTIAAIPAGAAFALGAFGEQDPPSQLLGWFLAVLGVAGAVLMFRQLRQTGPVIEIGPAGFHDRRLSNAPIPWPLIAGVTTKGEGENRNLVLAMSDATAHQYLRAGFTRSMRGLNGGVPIALGGLDHSFDDVWQAMQVYHQPRR